MPLRQSSKQYLGAGVDTATLPRSAILKRCWIEWAVVGFGLPAVTSGLAKLVDWTVPAAQHGSVSQRFLLHVSGGIAGEWLFILALKFVLTRRKQSLRGLGTWRAGTSSAWVLALLFAGVSIASNIRFLPRMHIPIVNAFLPHGFHLLAALAMGLTAGFCEEVLFRGFLMTEFALAGFGRFMQIFLPGVAFGFAHVGYSVHGFVAGVGIMLPTGLLGMIWGAAYLLGRRSLLPCIVAHFVNDATALPWIMFFMFTGSLG